jgi:protein-S-isoprenylcysteine O-methyltransferase Ste14
MRIIEELAAALEARAERRSFMGFAAAEWEFRARFWFIFGMFWLGFLLYSVDHTNVCAAISLFIFRHQPDASARIDRLIIVLFGAGTVLVALGALIRSWAESYLHSSIVHDAALHGEHLVADGPYRYVRNPLYMGNLLLAVGIGVLASRAGFVVLALGMWIFLYRLILREEATLLASQGESYRRYYAAVPRLLPALTPRVPASGAKPNWIDGFTGELFMWAAVAAMAVFTATQRLLYFWIVFGAGLGVYFLQAYLREHSNKSAE